MPYLLQLDMQGEYLSIPEGLGEVPQPNSIPDDQNTVTNQDNSASENGNGSAGDPEAIPQEEGTRPRLYHYRSISVQPLDEAIEACQQRIRDSWLRVENFLRSLLLYH
jgi:hypothetical protein